MGRVRPARGGPDRDAGGRGRRAPRGLARHVGRGGRRLTARRAARVVAAGVPIAFLAAFFVAPVVALVVHGLLPGERIPGIPAGDPVLEILARPGTGRALVRTLAQALAATACAVLLGVPGAYVLYRTSFPGRRLLRVVVAVPFVLPTVVVGVAFRAVLAPSGILGGLGLDRTPWALLAALVFVNYSVVVRVVGPAWAALDPRPAQAARTLGASPWRAMRTVTLPALTPAIVSAGALVALFCATSFGIVRTMAPLGWSTLETEIWRLGTRNLDLRGAAVLSLVQIVVVVAATVLVARSRGVPGRTRPVPTPPLDLRVPGQLAAAATTALAVGGLLLLPMLGLLERALRAPDGSWTFDHFRSLAGDGDGALPRTVLDAAELSLRAAVDATVLSLVVGLLAAVVIAGRPGAGPLVTAGRSAGSSRVGGNARADGRGQADGVGRTGRRGRILGRGRSLLDTLVMLPIGVSAVTVGFGMVLLSTWLPVDLRSSPLAVPIVQAVVAVPLVVRTVVPVLRAVQARQREVAATLGASPARVLRTIDGPALLRAGGVATGFAFAVSMGEFGATSFLARSTDPTLPVAIVRLLGRPGAETHGTAMAAAVLLAALTATVMALAERARAEGDAGW
ncbi:ABC transporter permease [Georgenia sp. Z1344]|uniref:ABC transporter permease n=1 Tax=Georgenia sp. Z1344 TaxID=3416706 RepID=UPI003CF9E9DA